METDREYKLEEISEILQVKATRTKAILKGLTQLDKIEAIGSNKERRYRVKNS